VAVAIDLEGRKDVLGLWTSAIEGSKFWLQVLTELRNRGVNDIFIVCADGLKGFPQAIEAVFPRPGTDLRSASEPKAIPGHRFCLTNRTVDSILPFVSGR
jgi:hypothetical protein